MSPLKERLHADVVAHMKDGNRVALGQKLSDNLWVLSA